MCESERGDSDGAEDTHRREVESPALASPDNEAGDGVTEEEAADAVAAVACECDCNGAC